MENDKQGKNSENCSQESTRVTLTTEELSSSKLSSRESNPLDVAILYKDTEISNGCGHTIRPWKADNLIDLLHCPICKDPVGMICDGLVSHNNNGDNNDDNQTIRFKFGKQIYQLSTRSIIIPAADSEKQQEDSWWMYFSSFILERKNSNSTKNKCTNTTLAQDRIANALNLVSLKVLHKGKIMYPPPNDIRKKNSNEDSEEPTQEVSISRTILKISDENWKSNKKTKKKVSLVVMGTLKERQLKGPTNNDNNGDNDCSLLQRLQYSLWFPVTILKHSLQLTWLLVKSFLGPFLPSYMLVGDDRNNDESAANDSRSTGQTRPHQD
ncbi:MAG: hypothetical protein ACI8RD_003061 [Bacillariaceae sp.]|jgi:hypothetical protein